MRLSTEDRKQVIIEVAEKVFRELGFERTSMTTISRRLGGSKGTLYRHFRSKEELFGAAMRAGMKVPGDQIMELLDPKKKDLRKMLERFASAYLTFLLKHDILAIKRTAAADGFSSSLGAHLFEKGPQRAVSAFTIFFADQMKRGRLRKASALSAALHFKGLIETGFLEEALYGAELQFKRPDAVYNAVDVFLRAYGVEAKVTGRAKKTPALR